jgi:integrase
MLHLGEWFQDFTEERRIMHNVSKKTLLGYRHAWACLGQGFLDRVEKPEHIKRQMKDSVHLSMRRVRAKERITEGTINTYITVINAFLRWCHEEDHLDRLIIIPKLKTQTKVRQTVADDVVKVLKSFNPKGTNQTRLKMAILICLDCGLRLNEVRKIKKQDVDLENNLLTVIGKGNKERIVPISDELRKHLFKYMKTVNHDYLFVTSGGKLYGLRNIARDLVVLCDRLKVEQFSFHQLRHTFATNYLKKGGDISRLKRIMGHSSIVVTQVYEHLNTQDLKKNFNNLSSIHSDIEED